MKSRTLNCIKGISNEGENGNTGKKREENELREEIIRRMKCDNGTTK